MDSVPPITAFKPGTGMPSTDATNIVNVVSNTLRAAFGLLVFEFFLEEFNFFFMLEGKHALAVDCDRNSNPLIFVFVEKV
jgi:hypothetical protein